MAAQRIVDYLFDTTIEDDLDKALIDLHDIIVAEGTKLIGSLCSWDRSGRQGESGGHLELIPEPLVAVMRFAWLPGVDDVVLIKRDDDFDGRPLREPTLGEVNNYGGGIVWVRADYDEKLGSVAELSGSAGRIYGWGELLIDAQETGGRLRRVFMSWLRVRYPNGQPRPGPTQLLYEFANETEGVPHISSVRRWLRLKK